MTKCKSAPTSAPVGGGGVVLHAAPLVVPDGYGFGRTRSRVLTPGAVLPRNVSAVSSMADPCFVF